MSIQLQGNTGVVAEVDGTTFRALRTVAKPVEHGALGQYRVSGLSGQMAAGLAANSEILQLRWTDATRLCVIQRVSLTGLRAPATAFVAGAIDLVATMIRSWTVDGSGGTTLTPTGSLNKLRTSMGTSLMGSLRIASTAALSAGTKTIDAQDIGRIATHSSAGTSASTPIIGNTLLPITDLFAADVGRGEHPLVLVQNEGLIVRATVPGTGVWNFGIDVTWAEVTAY